MTTDPNNTRFPSNYALAEDGWHDGYEANLDALDVEVIDIGPHADRPDPTADQAPNFYFSEDFEGGTLFQRSGTEWIRVTNVKENELPIVATGWADFKTKVESASEGAYVFLPPSTSNDFGTVRATSTITVPGYVTADATAVQIVPDTASQDCFDVNRFGDLRVRGATASALGEYSGSFIRVTGEGIAEKSLFDSTRITAFLLGESMFNKTNDANREIWGTGIHLDATANNGSISGIDVTASIRGFTEAIKLTGGTDSDSWVNGNRFSGRIGRAHRFVITEPTGSGGVSGNWFNMDFQPTRNPVGATESFVNFGGRNNIFRGQIFDRREVGDAIANLTGTNNRLETYNIAGHLDLVTGSSDNTVVEVRTGETFAPSPQGKRTSPYLHDTGVETIASSSSADIAFADNGDPSPNVFSGRAAPVNPPSESVFLNSVDARIYWDGSQYQIRIDNPASVQLDYRWSVYSM